jgi:HlyD family secretion protein
MKHADTDQNSNISQALGLGSTGRRGKTLNRWILWSLVVLGIVGAGIGWSQRNQKPKVQYKTQAATQGGLTVMVTATGNLEPTNKVDVSSELSGIVKSVEVDYNDAVKVGQVLARLDTAKLEAQVLQAQASLEAARAKVLQVNATIREARDQHDRLTNLAKMSGNKGVSESDLETARATLDRAIADEASARATVSHSLAVLEVNQTDLSKTRILSPVNGIVLTRSVEPGQTVASSLQAPVLFTLAEDLAQMELHVDVDEADVGQVKEGQRATFTVDAFPDRTFPARITQVRYASRNSGSSSSSSSSSTTKTTSGGVVTYETLLNVDNADLSLRPEMTATAEIVVREVENVTRIPNAALRFSPPTDQKQARSQGGNVLSKLFPRPPGPGPGGKQRPEAADGKKRQRVWILKDGEPVPVAIRTGVTDGTLTEVMEGEVTPGMELIVDLVSVSQ